MKGIDTKQNLHSGAEMRIAVVAARWNPAFTDGLISGALEALHRAEVKEKNITLFRVPGCFELPIACRKLAETKHFDGIVALGTLIRGDTDHYSLIATEAAAGLQRAMDVSGVPITFGVITANDSAQAAARSSTEEGNKGTEAAFAAVEMVGLLRTIKELEGGRWV